MTSDYMWAEWSYYLCVAVDDVVNQVRIRPHAVPARIDWANSTICLAERVLSLRLCVELLDQAAGLAGPWTGQDALDGPGRRLIHARSS